MTTEVILAVIGRLLLDGVFWYLVFRFAFGWIK